MRKKTSSLHAAIYCRGGECGAQRLMCAKSINTHPDWTLADVYIDEAVPASRMAGPQTAFTQMLKDCQTGTLDKIVVLSVSRFSRSLVDTMTLLRTLSAQGVTVHFVKEGIDTEVLAPQTVQEVC